MTKAIHFSKAVFQPHEIPILIDEVEGRLGELEPTEEVSWWKENSPGRVVGGWSEIRGRIATVLQRLGGPIQPSSRPISKGAAIDLSVVAGGGIYQTVLFQAEGSAPGVYTYLFYDR